MLVGACRDEQYKYNKTCAYASHKVTWYVQLPYSGKVWQWESLAKLANLAKLQVIRQLKPAKF